MPSSSTVESKILVFGYIRKFAEGKHNLVIPSDIVSLCYNYWFHDCWDDTNSNCTLLFDDHYQLLQTTIPSADCTAFGSLAIDSGIFVWNLLLYAWPHVHPPWCSVGIIKSDSTALKQYAYQSMRALHQDNKLDDEDMLYGFCTNGCVYQNAQEQQVCEPFAKCLCGTVDPSEWDELAFCERVFMQLILDLDRRTLTLQVGDEEDEEDEQGKGDKCTVLSIKDVRPASYRLYACFGENDHQLEIL